MTDTRKTNRMAAKELLENLYEGFLAKEFIPVAIWTERSYAQVDHETYFYYKTADHYDDVHMYVVMCIVNILAEKKISIYPNHIVLEFNIEDFGTIYLGINDGYLSISKQMATIHGKRIEL